MKQLLFAFCIAGVLMFSDSIAAAQDDSQQDVITMEGPVVPAEAAYPESQTQTTAVPDTAPAAMPPRGPGWAEVVFMFFMFAFFAVVVLIGVFLWCRIYSKTGYSWAFGLLMIVPVANLVMLCVLAFSEWPALREVKSLRQQLEKTV